jgi:hypothetical protein
MAVPEVVMAVRPPTDHPIRRLSWLHGARSVAGSARFADHVRFPAVNALRSVVCPGRSTIALDV